MKNETKIGAVDLVAGCRLRSLLFVACLGFVLFLTGCGPSVSKERAQALAFLNPERDFVLVDQDSKEFHLKDHRGKIVLLFFGYLSCPDVCPVTMSKISRVYAQLGGRAKDVLTVFVSVDPNRDTSQKLKEYLKYFKINAVGLTGTKEQIDKVVDAFKAYYKINESSSEAGYFVDHSDYVYVIDGQGGVYDLIHFDDPAEKIARSIREVL